MHYSRMRTDRGSGHLGSGLLIWAKGCLPTWRGCLLTCRGVFAYLEVGVSAYLLTLPSPGQTQLDCHLEAVFLSLSLSYHNISESLVYRLCGILQKCFIVNILEKITKYENII